MLNVFMRRLGCAYRLQLVHKADDWQLRIMNIIEGKRLADLCLDEVQMSLSEPSLHQC